MAKEKNEVTEKKDYVLFSVREPDNRNFLMCYICDTDEAYDRECKSFSKDFRDRKDRLNLRGKDTSEACFIHLGVSNRLRMKRIFDDKHGVYGNIFGGLFFHKNSLTFEVIAHEAHHASVYFNEELVGYSDSIHSIKLSQYNRERPYNELAAYRIGAYVDRIVKKCFELKIPIKYNEFTE